VKPDNIGTVGLRASAQPTGAAGHSRPFLALAAPVDTGVVGHRTLKQPAQVGLNACEVQRIRPVGLCCLSPSYGCGWRLLGESGTL